ncbi:u18-Nephitoxin-Nsp1ab_1 [Trichonephila clavata]|uniref:U18-Nephitoxin-Nsp1ab_1 n=1 Tax=Trichonephila clavata TaxID=2740835 RepID=A0A8X6HWD3_TRICU|nr:u18-Nephitoxin-Nsp1ab_1 [Trichonephila clavata]
MFLFEYEAYLKEHGDEFSIIVLGRRSTSIGTSIFEVLLNLSSKQASQNDEVHCSCGTHRIGSTCIRPRLPGIPEDVLRPGMQGDRLHHVGHASLPQDVRSVLELPNFLTENRAHQMWNFVNSSSILFLEVWIAVEIKKFFRNDSEKEMDKNAIK